MRPRITTATMFNENVKINNVSTVAYKSGRVWSMFGDCVERMNT